MNLLVSNSTANLVKADESEKLFQKLLKEPKSRTRLESVHAARAFKYGGAHFGPKYWYKESQNISTKLKTQKDRRKFRQGLKANLDFLNQLNIMNLVEVLSAGDPGGLKILTLNEPAVPSHFLEFMKNVPPLKVLDVCNKESAKRVAGLLRRISTLAHFSQSLTDYFAHDDALEPALAVVCEALRGGPEVGVALEKQASSFIALAQCYQKNRSYKDRDAVFDKKSNKKRSSSQSSRRGYRRRSGAKFSKGICFRFQRLDGCSDEGCKFPHKCVVCSSKNHGKAKCPRKNRSNSRKNRSNSR